MTEQKMEAAAAIIDPIAWQEPNRSTNSLKWIKRRNCARGKADQIVALLTTRSGCDCTVISAWMREPDYVENASLEWLTDWINRRPLSALNIHKRGGET